jgi:hypothetical protein
VESLPELLICRVFIIKHMVKSYFAASFCIRHMAKITVERATTNVGKLGGVVPLLSPYICDSGMVWWLGMAICSRTRISADTRPDEEGYDYEYETSPADNLDRLQQLPQTLPCAQNEEGTDIVAAPAVGANDAAKCGRRSPHTHTWGN